MVKWVENFTSKFTSGVAHAFILHGNVGDYAVPGTTLKSYLGKLLASRDIVAFFNRSEGITFPIEAQRAEFVKLLGLDKQGNDILAALNGPGGNEVELPKSPDQALPLLERLLKSPVKCAVILEYAESICPNADLDKMPASERSVLVTLQRWGVDAEIAKAGNPILMIAADLGSLHANVKSASSKWEAVELPIPDYESRLEFIKWYLSQRNGFTKDLDEAQLASATAGLSLVHIEDIFLRASQAGHLGYDLVKERKADIIASEYGEVLQILDPEAGFESVGGLQYVKDFFTRSVIQPMKDGRFGRVPMGVLMTGPAGTGKSIMAEAVAKESGINFVILNPAQLFGQYVGNTERNLDKALKAIEALAPCGVFIDEIDQMVSRGGSGDSGVGSRFFKRLLEFMSDGSHRGKVIFLAATNRPDLMDAALRRPGRFDKKVPFLVPDRDERKAIFDVMACKYGLGQIEDYQYALDNTDGYTGAEIEAVTVKAVELAEDYGLDPAAALNKAVDAISPSTADIEFMTAIAIRECNDKDLLPPSYQSKLDDRQALESQIAGMQQAMRGKREL